jgi:hypothetical protein
LLFGFRLAREFGCPDVGRFLRELPWEDFKWWMAYYAIEPWGETRDDLRAGVVASAVYNVNRSKQSDRVWSPADFLLTRPDEPARSARQTKGCRQLEDPTAWALLKAQLKASIGA